MSNKYYKNNTLLTKFPIKRQRYSYDCAVCSLWCILYYFNNKISYRDVQNLIKTDKLKGTDTVNIKRLLKKLKIKFIAEKSTITKLRHYSSHNYPALVHIQHRKETRKDWLNTWKYGHYIVVLTVDDKKVVFMDPKYGKIKSLLIKQFKERWHDNNEKNTYKNYAIVCFYK